MNKLALAAAAAALLGGAPAAASPPPLPVAVTYTPATPETATLHGTLVDQGWFGRTPSALPAEVVATCAGSTRLEACLRDLTHSTVGEGPPEVVVVVTDEGGKSRLVCIGPGAAFKNRERQTALIDLRNPGREDRSAAAGCIIAAAAESGW